MGAHRKGRINVDPNPGLPGTGNDLVKKGKKEGKGTGRERGGRKTSINKTPIMAHVPIFPPLPRSSKHPVSYSLWTSPTVVCVHVFAIVSTRKIKEKKT